jgi:TPR repeat protein
MRRRAFVRYAATILVVASAVPLAGWLQEHDAVTPVVTPEPGPPPDFPELRASTQPRPMPQWDGYQAGNHGELRIRYRWLCNGGDLDACDSYASMLRSGVGGPPDQELALAISSRACKRGHGDSCLLASAQRQRLGLPPARLR